MRALIGYTGFVGLNLLSQIKFDSFYNSKNIAEIKDKEYDEVYCAGAPAAKWIANQNPSQDLYNIFTLLDAISSIKTKRFILISTIDVYKDTISVNEDTTIDLVGHHAYGTNRRLLETFVSERFSKYNIIRLPGLFGKGLKKNIIYDFLHDNETFKIHSEAMFQFYSLDNIAKDIELVIENDVKLINFATEPVSVKEIAKEAFAIDFNNSPTQNVPFYDIHTKYANIFGEFGTYIKSKDVILDEARNFIKKAKERL